MIESKYKRFQTSLIETKEDLLTFKLSGNLFWINDKIYANMCSYPLKEEDRPNFLKTFTEEELEGNFLNRIHKIKVYIRTEEDEYLDGKHVGFDELKTIIEDNIKTGRTSRIHIDYSDEEVIYLPLYSNILRSSAIMAHKKLKQMEYQMLYVDVDIQLTNDFINLF